MKDIRKYLTMLCFLFFGLVSIKAQNYYQDPSWRVNTQETEVMVPLSGYAIDGYDTVAYFTIGKPQKGKEKFMYRWKDANWIFASNKHLKLFKNNPEKYAPQYGGWCAFGMSGHGRYGYGAQTKPETSWTIYNDKLYLNFNPKVVVAWNKKKDEYIKMADKYWLEVSKKISDGSSKVHWQEKEITKN